MKLYKKIIILTLLCNLVFVLIGNTIPGNIFQSYPKNHSNCSCGCDINSTSCCCNSTIKGIAFENCSTTLSNFIILKPIWILNDLKIISFPKIYKPNFPNNVIYWLSPQEVFKEIDHPPHPGF